MSKQNIKYTCENCGKVYSSLKKNKYILCDKCKTAFYRERQKKKYVPKNKEDNYFFKKAQRNEEIIRIFDSGAKIVDIAKVFNLSSMRIRQIIQTRKENIWKLE